MNTNTEERKKLIWFLKLVIIILVITGISDLIISFYGSPTIPKTRNPFTSVTYTPTPSPRNTFIVPTTSASSTATPIPFPSKTIASPAMKACPMDAKMCPDGKTFVGRDGPNCEFVECPK